MEKKVSVEEILEKVKDLGKGGKFHNLEAYCSMRAVIANVLATNYRPHSDIFFPIDCAFFRNDSFGAEILPYDCDCVKAVKIAGMIRLLSAHERLDVMKKIDDLIGEYDVLVEYECKLIE